MKKYLILGLALIMTSLVFYSCKKEKVEIQPNDLSTTYRTSNSDYNFLPPYIKERIYEYATQINGLSFKDRFGKPDSTVYISSHLSSEIFVEMTYLKDANDVIKHLLVGATSKEGSTVYILSPDSRITPEQETIYPLRNVFMSLFPSNPNFNSFVSRASLGEMWIALPPGCYRIVACLECPLGWGVVSVKCPENGGGGGGGGSWNGGGNNWNGGIGSSPFPSDPSYIGGGGSDGFGFGGEQDGGLPTHTATNLLSPYFSTAEIYSLYAQTPAAFAQIAIYIQANSPLTPEQINYVQLHEALAMNEPSFNQSLEIGSEAWINEVLSIPPRKIEDAVIVEMMRDVLLERWEEVPDSMITDSLASFPCAKNLIDSLQYLDDTISIKMWEIFGTTEDIDIIFEADSSLPDSIDGTSEPQSSQNIFYFKTFIKLNPNLSNKDYILATIIHEMYHAYIGYYKYKRLQGQITAEEFKEMFPILLTTTANQEHQEMAANYVDKMKGVLMSFNPNISANVAEALAWGGLHDTNAWNALSEEERNNIITINQNAKSANPPASYNLIDCD